MPHPTHIIVSSLSLLSILTGYRLVKKFQARLVFEIRDIWPLSLVLGSSLTDKNPLVRVLSWIERFGYRNADVVVGTMPNLIKHVHSVSGPSVRVETVGLGIDPDLQESAESTTNVAKSSSFTVAYSGSIGRANALEKLLAVAAEFSVTDGVTFEFFGKGDYLAGFRKKYANHSHIIFHGAVPRSDLLHKLKSTDVVFFAAEDSEIWKYGQSLHKIVEYMTLGRPIIAAYTGFPSMIDEADCGVFVPSDSADALRQQVFAFKAMTATERNAMGERGKIWILNHRTYAKLAEKYLKILESL